MHKQRYCDQTHSWLTQSLKLKILWSCLPCLCPSLSKSFLFAYASSGRFTPLTMLYEVCTIHTKSPKNPHKSRKLRRSKTNCNYFWRKYKIICTAWKSKSLQIAHIRYEPIPYVLNTEPPTPTRLHPEMVKTPFKSHARIQTISKAYASFQTE